MDELAHFSDAEAPAVTRVLFTDKDLAARAFIKKLCRAAQLSVREDPLGNLFARWIGTEPSIARRRHRFAYRRDSLFRTLRRNSRRARRTGSDPRPAIDAVSSRAARSSSLMFTSEEPTRFGFGCVGSRTMSGALSSQQCADLRDGEDQRLDDVRRQAGFQGNLDDVRLAANYYSSFVELHIEQGPILEREGIAIGAVTAIAAPAAMRVKLEGAGGHAGAVLMPERRDALCAAAEVVLAVEAAAKATGSPDTVGTVGVCQVHPGAINSVPSAVTLTIDVRDVAREPRDTAVRAIQEAIREIGARRKVTAAIEMLNADPPAKMDTAIVETIEKSAQEAGFSCRRMVSRAYHDSLFMARLGPTGMIFIPCRDGVSHRPDEYSSPEAIAAGVEVLGRTLAILSMR